MPSQGRAITFACLVAAFVALLSFAWLASGVARGQAFGFDASARDLVQARAFPGLTYAMKAATYIGSSWFVVGAGLLAVWRFSIAGQGRSAVLLVVSTASTEAIDQILKIGFHRARPDPFFGFASPGGYSFPSDHAFTSCCFYCLLTALAAARLRSARTQAGLWLLAGALVAAIGFSRVYLGVHYLSDVLAGYCALVMWLAALRVGYFARLGPARR